MTNKNKIIEKAISCLERNISEIEDDIENSIRLISKYKETIENYKSKIFLDYKVGAVFIAINECEMEDDLEDALIIGKEYEVLATINDKGEMNIIVKSEKHNEHLFPFTEVLNYFKIK